MNYLFPNFLTDDEEFEKSKDYWRSLCQEILAKNNQVDNWKPWFSDESANRKLYENFPVCALINGEKSKGVTINQQDPEQHRKWEVVAWTETYVREANEFWPSEYLVFNCNLTEENAHIFKKLFEAWIQPDFNRMQLEQLISEVLPK